MLTTDKKYLIPPLSGGMCMKGGIYSNEKCPVCGGVFKDNGNSLICPNHKNVRATRLFVKFGTILKRFRSYDQGYRFLTGLRFKTDENTLDERDYKKNNPLGFINMSDKFLAAVNPQTAKNMKPHIKHAQNCFQNRNVKELKCGDFEDFLNTLNLSDKTKHNIISTMHVFYKWMLKRQEIIELPEFPEVSFVLGYRRTVDKATQIAIIEEVKRICSNPKVFLGIKWLATYFSIRPAEMIKLKEGEIDTGNGYLYFPHPKEKTFKSVPILPEDVEILKSFPTSFPSMPFFRHDGGIKGTKKDQPFGIKYFYKWWIRACENLDIKDVDLYGGTRHSTVRALRKYRSPEEIKEAAMSKTNKAFDRYLGQANDSDILSIYKQSAEVIPISKLDTALIPDFKVLKIDK